MAAPAAALPRPWLLPATARSAGPAGPRHQQRRRRRRRSGSQLGLESLLYLHRWSLQRQTPLPHSLGLLSRLPRRRLPHRHLLPHRCPPDCPHRLPRRRLPSPPGPSARLPPSLPVRRPAADGTAARLPPRPPAASTRRRPAGPGCRPPAADCADCDRRPPASEAAARSESGRPRCRDRENGAR